MHQMTLKRHQLQGRSSRRISEIKDRLFKTIQLEDNEEKKKGIKKACKNFGVRLIEEMQGLLKFKKDVKVPKKWKAQCK